MLGKLGRIDGDPVLRETRIWATWEYVSSVGGGQQGMVGSVLLLVVVASHDEYQTLTILLLLLLPPVFPFSSFVWVLRLNMLFSPKSMFFS